MSDSGLWVREDPRLALGLEGVPLLEVNVQQVDDGAVWQRLRAVEAIDDIMAPRRQVRHGQRASHCNRGAAQADSRLIGAVHLEMDPWPLGDSEHAQALDREAIGHLSVEAWVHDALSRANLSAVALHVRIFLQGGEI